MRRWERWNREFREQRENEAGGGNPPPPQNQDQHSEGSHTGSEEEVQSPFKSEALKGMTEEQILQRMQVLEAAARARADNSPPARHENEIPAPQKPEKKDPSAAEYWENPTKINREIIREEVKGMLEEVISPFRENLSEGKMDRMRNALRQEFPDFATYEPIFDQLVAKSGNQNPSMGDLKILYYTAKGYAASHGAAQPSTPQNNQQQRQVPPQHRAANQPVNTQNEQKKPLRDLTETEEYFRRESGLSKADWLALHDADQRDVLTTKLEAENAKS